LTTTTLLPTQIKFNLKRWHKALILALVIFVLFVLEMVFSGSLAKLIVFGIMVVSTILSFFWLEKKETWRRRLAKYSLPFILILVTGGYAMIFSLNFVAFGIGALTSLSYYFFASRLKLPLPYDVREEVTYYWLDIVIFWVGFLFFVVSYYFIFYFSNFGTDLTRFLTFSIVLFLISFYLTAFSLWARSRHRQEIIFYGLFFGFVVSQFAFLWGFYRMAPFGGALIYMLMQYYFIEMLGYFFRYQFVRRIDIVRLSIVMLVLLVAVMLIFKPFIIIR
jgi:hypothetical protein